MYLKQVFCFIRVGTEQCEFDEPSTNLFALSDI